MFRASTLLRSSCSSSTTATATSCRFFSCSATHPAGDGEGDVILSFSSIPGDQIGRRSARFTLDCGGCGASRPSEPALQLTHKKERRVRETGALYETGEGEGRTCPPASPTSPSSPSNNFYYYYYFNKMEEEEEEAQKQKMATKKKKKKKSKKLLSNAYGFTSSSSDDSDDGFGFFSSEGGEEGVDDKEDERFFSSRSFSSDSSGFYQRPSPKTKKNKVKKKRRQQASGRRPPLPPRRKVRSNGYQPVVSVCKRREEKAADNGDGFAVVKKSSDPYADFRSSMVEMIVERQVFGEEELERLLQSYLTLNSPRHHEAILKAFSDVWEVLFSH